MTKRASKRQPGSSRASVRLHRFARMFEGFQESPRMFESFKSTVHVLAPAFGPEWQRGLADSVRSIGSAEWQEVVFQTLQQLDVAETEAASTWWLGQPLKVRATVVAVIVWTYVFS